MVVVVRVVVCVVVCVVVVVAEVVGVVLVCVVVGVVIAHCLKAASSSSAYVATAAVKSAAPALHCSESTEMSSDSAP